MPRISFAGPTYVARSPNINLERSVNFYVENNPNGSKAPETLIGTPGTSLWATVGSGVIRGKHIFNSLLFVVSGNTLYSVTTAGVATSRGTLNTSTGRVSMQNNGLAVSGIGGNQLIIVDGTNGYIYNVSTAVFSTISSAGFPANPVMVEYLDGYFITFGSGRMAYAVSNLYDGTTWNALAKASILASPEGIQAVLAVHQQLWFIKQDTSEVWYNAGTPTSQGSPFSRIPGTVLDLGTSAPWSVARGDGGLFLLGNMRVNGVGTFAGVMKIDGTTPKIISNTAINYQIQQLSTITDAFGYCYTDEGHTFYVLAFPTGNWTIVYDVTTQQWHERSLYISGDPYTVNRHVGNSYAYFDNKHLVGDYRANGKVYHVSSAYYDDAGVDLISSRTTQYMHDESGLKTVFFHELQVDMETAVGGSVVADPQAILSWSDDGGRNWSSDRVMSMGQGGEYTKRLVWRRLGRSRARVFRLSISDAVKRTITGAYIKAGL
jgi:hypothetical protein